MLPGHVGEPGKKEEYCFAPSSLSDPFVSVSLEDCKAIPAAKTSIRSGEIHEELLTADEEAAKVSDEIDGHKKAAGGAITLSMPGRVVDSGRRSSLLCCSSCLSYFPPS